MQFHVITILPEMFCALQGQGVTARALRQGLASLTLWNPRDYTTDVHRTVDDRPYGGGPGMVMKPEPLSASIQAARAQAPKARVAYLSPQGQLLNQQTICQLVERSEIILIAGRYEGIDERIIDAYVDEEWSLGDYVLSGGELAAMVLMDAVIRLLPGALGHQLSAEQDSYMHGLLDCPHYTRPECFEGRCVPAVLLSGDHAAIERWRLEQALQRTQQRRPELLEK